jgi:hypothetical protein
VGFGALQWPYRVLQWLYGSRTGSYRGKIPCSLMTFDGVLRTVKVKLDLTTAVWVGTPPSIYPREYIWVPDAQYCRSTDEEHRHDNFSFGATSVT